MSWPGWVGLCLMGLGLLLVVVGLLVTLPRALRIRSRVVALRELLDQGGGAVIEELEGLAAGKAAGSPVWREINYLTKHSEAGRLRYNCFRCRGVPLGSGAIESTIRRVINLRLKGTSIYWTEENAEAVFQLRAAVVSGRWDEVMNHTQEAMARDRRTDWRWTPPECLAELKALGDEDEESTQPSTKKQSKRTAA